MRRLLYILLFSADMVFGQNLCDDKSLADLETQFNKADKKGRADEYKIANMAFDIAECYRQRNDSTSLKWYRNNIRTTKSAIKGCDRREEARNLLFRMGVSSYFLAEYKDAEKYLQKAIAGYSDVDSYYYLGKTLIQLNMWQEAKIEFINYRSKSSSHSDVDELIKTCDDNINGR